MSMRATQAAAAFMQAMIYQIAKETGAMAAVLEGRADAVVLTGGMAHSERLVSRLRTYIDWIAPVTAIRAKMNCRLSPKAFFAC